MAHIPDGVLSAPVLISGAALTIGFTAVALKRLDYDRIPQAAMLAAALFIASLVTIPVGVSSVHLLLNGLMGLMLGWVAVPAILVALTLQAMFFGYGGLIVLGANTLNMALPALLCGAILLPWLKRSGHNRGFMIGACAGAIGVVGTALMVGLSLAFSGDALIPAAKVVAATYLPLLLVEAAVTGAIVGFLQKVAPHILNQPVPQHA
ncbi:cobalt transporter CbiM [Marinobacterium jannaschii]|uniref:cobalt transporter CbiM n=1 Tax=Marinobacterium jannaschii TaxID=64970 RepID=UPI0004833B61|nr:cobalt transporter CbiM [Marinobacterium jannaschii]